jgi:hypothetical protein
MVGDQEFEAAGDYFETEFRAGFFETLTFLPEVGVERGFVLRINVGGRENQQNQK